ncbi:MAG: GNAT family N-acetyltransferase [Planctomycetota bacterium]
MTAPLSIRPADLASERDAEAVIAMLDAYARDPAGDGKPLADKVRARLIEGLRQHPTTVVLLAWDGDTPIGVATCFVGFSTFAAAPLLNVHDLAVVPAARGRGVGRALLRAAEEEARRRGCCKLTLVVLEHNDPARKLYESEGYRRATYNGGLGGALFYAKQLS